MAKDTQEMFGNNSAAIKDQIQKMAEDYAKCDEESAALNDRRAEIRDRAKELGLDTEAWQFEIGRAKKSLKKRDGYDESCQVIRDAIGDMDMEDLFAHVLRREREKEEAREAKRAERAAEKEKADSYKPAPERKPKPVKDVGQAQAEAYFAANPASVQ